MNYRMKPVMVSAFQYGVDDEPEWFKILCGIGIKDHEPVASASDGDFIVFGAMGNVQVMSEAIFKASCEAIE